MNEPGNPYAAPKARMPAEVSSLPDGADAIDRLLESPAKAPASAGSAWIKASWDLFRRAPGMLIAVLVLYLLISFIVGFLPLVGDLVMTLTFGIWSAGWMLIADRLRQGQSVTVGDLFAGFSHPRVKRLFGIGVVNVLAVIAVLAVAGGAAFVLIGFQAMQAMFEDVSRFDPASFGLALFLVIALMLIGLAAVFAVVGFAPVLICRHDVTVMQACSMSFVAFLRNWLSISIAGLITMLLFVVALIPLGLGLLVLLPMMFLLPYVSYRQIFLAR